MEQLVLLAGAKRNMKIKIFIIILLFSTSSTYAKHLNQEKVYQKYWCDKYNGEIEYILDDNTRVDCLLPNLAVEFDFAPKWAECIGQAIYYGKKTKRTPACVLIMENNYNDNRHLQRLHYAADNNLRIYTINPDVISK